MLQQLIDEELIFRKDNFYKYINKDNRQKIKNNFIISNKNKNGIS